MTCHIIAVTIGPVQEFIASARRTRDLWFGSFLLSELSRAAAKAICEADGELIFPAPAKPAELEPASPKHGRASIANVVLARINSDPKLVAKQAKEAVRRRWREFADPVHREFGRLINSARWDNQVDDVIEVYSAWSSLESEADYPQVRKRVMRLLAGRKALRDFRPAFGEWGVPKSSLDGLRETVLNGLSESERPIWLNQGEQLDVVGLMKRVADAETFPSVSRVAADPWLRGCTEDQLNGLAMFCEQLPRDAVSRIDVSRSGHSKFASFPFDGTVVYPSRQTELKKCGVAPEQLTQLRQLLKAREGEVSPYLAVLIADGDRMGELISNLANLERHREFSQALAGFSLKAQAVVRENFGVLVYAGGDDVLAFVPADKALDCARDLSKVFADTLAEFSIGGRATLSVGVAIAHYLEPMEDLLGYGRQAEHHAKNPRNPDEGCPRNGLAVHLIKRGGGPIEVRANWDDDLCADLGRLVRWINEKQLSGRLAYDLRKLSDFYHGWPHPVSRNTLVADCLALLDKKRPERSEKLNEFKQEIHGRIQSPDDVAKLSHRMLVARLLAEVARQVPKSHENTGEAE